MAFAGKPVSSMLSDVHEVTEIFALMLEKMNKSLLKIFETENGMKLRAQKVTNTTFLCLQNKAFVLNKLLKKHWGVNLRYFTFLSLAFS